MAWHRLQLLVLDLIYWTIFFFSSTRRAEIEMSHSTRCSNTFNFIVHNCFSREVYGLLSMLESNIWRVKLNCYWSDMCAVKSCDPQWIGLLFFCFFFSYVLALSARVAFESYSTSQLITFFFGWRLDKCERDEIDGSSEVSTFCECLHRQMTTDDDAP